ncbi:C4-dicarboxylate ABC transporter [Exilibacterium tricleocarpae]|uniref:C4-dicarboxylate ABC transporter n=1 Tax=Exilibacterium tricleocarpae TaxID=2591008 RepID=A0A545TZG1_9GAMM|nr:TRAP transporter substrate-binding protein DctP [Exilibacterium tricleocarpae]TQV82612.1 C4-dicarboxylate ABC transporter [Exilibacterium tricleocarpae]
MKLLKRTTLVRGLLLLALSLSAGGAGAVVLKIATVSPDGSSWMVKMRAGAKAVTEATEGRVKFKFYPGGVMGNDRAVLRKIRLGQLQGGAVPGGSLAKFAPNSQLYNLPLLFRSFREVDFVRERMDRLIVEELEDGGFVTFGLGEGGLAYLMTDAEVTQVEQLRKKKVWVPDNDPTTVGVVESFGVSPIPLSIGDVLPGLQTGMIDTVATSPIAALALQWHTQVSHMTDIPLLYFYAVLAIDKKVFNRLEAGDQIVVRDIMGKVFADIDKQNRKDNLDAFAAMQKQGITLSRPSSEQADIWHQSAERAIDDIVQNGGVSKPLYQQLMDYLEQYRGAQAKL